jgi:glycyl-tRNA synthetase beta chain
MLHIEEERILFDEIRSMEKLVTPLLERSDYEASLKLLAGLRAPVDNFFDAVMVMDEDTALRDNRLALLTRLKSLFDRIADLSVLA